MQKEQLADGGPTLRPKGAVALLHRKGKPRPTLDRQKYLSRWMEGLSLLPKGAAALLHQEGESPLRRRIGWRAPTATEGSHGSAALGGRAPSAAEYAA
ncbi:hypothetical protein ROHU_000081 [Labeo rohita]|uniref:Uncharacterized protein n=1 Tax=Labeo rohita TaxID=84645 RepID=A0A498P4F7_LABRO|nr:hypothetical protein ROHU_000081 [Labeo rohita]